MLEFDRVKGKVVNRYPAFDDPAVAVSDDGTRLFIASFHPNPGYDNRKDILKIIDTSSGDTLKEVGLNNLRWGFPGTVLFPTVAPSSSGDLLFVLQQDSSVQGRFEDSIGTVDLSSGELLPERIVLPSCGGGSLLPLSEPRTLAVVCPDANSVWFLRVAADGSAQEASPVSLARVSDGGADAYGNPLYLNRISWAVADRNRGIVYAVTGGGHVYVVDIVSLEVLEEIDLELPADTSVSLNKVALSPDGSVLVLGLGSAVGDGVVFANQILKVSTNDWRAQAVVDVGEPYWSFELLDDDIFAVSPRNQAVIHIDSRGRRTARYQGVGIRPELIVAP